MINMDIDNSEERVNESEINENKKQIIFQDEWENSVFLRVV